VVVISSTAADLDPRCRGGLGGKHDLEFLVARHGPGRGGSGGSVTGLIGRPDTHDQSLGGGAQRTRQHLQGAGPARVVGGAAERLDLVVAAA
jgi:hypothetical protein